MGDVRAFRAAALFDGERLLRDAAFLLDGLGVCLAAGPAGEVLPAAGLGREARDLGDALVLPGLANAHTHVELSALAGLVPATAPPAPEGAFLQWAGGLVATRRRLAEAPGDPLGAGLFAGAQALAAAGTALVGDVTNGGDTAAALAAAGLEGCIFHEVFGWDEARVGPALDALDGGLLARAAEARAVGFRYAPAPHTPYTLSPASIARLRALAARLPGAIGSIHLLEHGAERRAIEDGEGPAAEWLAALSAAPPTWPRRPALDYAEGLGLLDGRTLLVHVAVARPDELARVAAAGNPIVLCPRSNRYILDAAPPIAAALAAGCRVALGTDSAASNADLDLVGEIAALHALAPDVPLARLFAAATVGGADALGAPLRCRFTPGATPRPFATPFGAAEDPLAALLAGRDAPRTPLYP